MTCDCKAHTTIQETIPTIDKGCCDTNTCLDRKSTYYVTLRVRDTWIMPAINEQTILYIEHARNLLPGSWLWNASVGYLKIESYNNATGETSVTNLGYIGNAAKDTVFPTCMEFVVTAPIHYESIDLGLTCLAADFISPVVGSCALMSVVSTANFKKNYIIAVEDYQYKVDEVISSTILRVCNEGAGKDGTIDAPCDGTCLPVRVINAEDVCLQDAVSAVNAIVSCVDGTPKLFVGNEQGQVAYWENQSGEWVLINSNIEVDCTVTTATVTLDVGSTGPYLFLISDSSMFSIEDRITVGEDKDAYVVSEILSSTQIRLTKNIAPTESSVYDIGTRLCIVDCCDWLPEVVEQLESRVTSIENQLIVVNNTLNQHQLNINDLYNTKEDLYFRGELYTSSNNNVLTIDNGINILARDTETTIHLDTDLSKYNNLNSRFVTIGSSLGTGSPIYAGYSDDATTGNRTLQFNSLQVSNPNFFLSTSNNVVTIGAHNFVIAGESVGTGIGTYYDTTTDTYYNKTLRFKSLLAGTNISLTDNGSGGITITGADAPIPATYSMNNVGSGAGKIYVSGTNPFQIKSISAGTGVTVTNNSSDITISAAFGGISVAQHGDTGDVSGTLTTSNVLNSSATAHTDITISNPSTTTTMNVLACASSRCALVVGDTATHSFRGEVKIKHKLQLGVLSGGTFIQSNVINVDCNTSQLSQKAIRQYVSSDNVYHEIEGYDPTLTCNYIFSIAANSSLTIRIIITYTKLNDKYTASDYTTGGTYSSGDLTWHSGHAEVDILAVIS